MGQLTKCGQPRARGESQTNRDAAEHCKCMTCYLRREYRQERENKEGEYYEIRKKENSIVRIWSQKGKAQIMQYWRLSVK